MSEYLLEPAELIFLMTTFGATSIVGVDRAILMDKSGNRNRTQWELGYRLFQDRGWLVRGDDDRYKMDKDIARIGSIMVDPKLAIICRIYTAPAKVSTITYYLGESLIVEQAYTKTAQYRLVTLDNTNTMTARVIEPLHLADSELDNPYSFTLNATILEQVVEAVRMNDIQDSARILASQNISETTIDILVETLVSGKKLAEFEVGIPNDDPGSNPYGSVLVQSSTGDWILVYSPPFETVTLEQVSSYSFNKRLRDWINRFFTTALSAT